MASSGARDGLMTEINVTPLVDVVLVLLVIMMMAATAIATRTIPVELPRAHTGESDGTRRPSVVGVDEAGLLYLGGVHADAPAVQARARELAAAGPQGSAVL